MFRVRKSDIPASALVKAYQDQAGARVDCYRICVDRAVTLESFVGCFYRGQLFRMERALINLFTPHKSSDAQLEDLLSGKSKIFSVWTEVERTENQLIMRDYQERTCSWFMVVPYEGGTHLYFGSVFKHTHHFGRLEWLSKPIFTLCLPLHGLYSRLLLGAAAKR